MKASGKKEKGRRLELKVAKELRKIDKNAGRMPGSGAFVHLKADIRTNLPYHIECKNQEKVKIWDWWEQTTSHKTHKKPVLVFSGNYRPIMACMTLEDWVDLVQEKMEWEQTANEYKQKLKDSHE